MSTQSAKMRRITQKISQHRQAKRMSNRSSDVGHNNNAGRNQTKGKRIVFHFKLIGVFIGDTEFTPAELQHCITSRVLNKPIVTVTLSNGNVEVRHGKSLGSKCVLSSAVSDVCGVLTTVFEPRAIAFSAYNPDSWDSYSSVVLMARKKMWQQETRDVERLSVLLASNVTRSRGSQLSKHGQGWLSEQQAPGMLSEQQAPGMVSKEQEILVSTAEESFQFKLVSVVHSNNGLTPKKLEEYLKARTKDKLHATVTLHNGNILVERETLAGPESIISCSLADVCNVFQSSSEPRAIGFSTLHPGNFWSMYTTIVLVAKKSVIHHTITSKFHRTLLTEMDLVRSRELAKKNAEAAASATGYLSQLLFSIPDYFSWNTKESTGNTIEAQQKENDDTRQSFLLTFPESTVNLDTKTFQFKLIWFLYGKSELSSAELEQHLKERRKERAIVTVTTSNGHIMIQNKYEKVLLSCALADISSILQPTSQPRVIGFTAINRGGYDWNAYSSVVLMAKNSPWARNDVMKLGVILLSELSLPSSRTHQGHGANQAGASKICVPGSESSPQQAHCSGTSPKQQHCSDSKNCPTPPKQQHCSDGKNCPTPSKQPVCIDGKNYRISSSDGDNCPTPSKQPDCKNYHTPSSDGENCPTPPKQPDCIDGENNHAPSSNGENCLTLPKQPDCIDGKNYHTPSSDGENCPTPPKQPDCIDGKNYHTPSSDGENCPTPPKQLHCSDSLAELAPSQQQQQQQLCSGTPSGKNSPTSSQHLQFSVIYSTKCLTEAPPSFTAPSVTLPQATFRFKLVGVINGQNELTFAEMRQCISQSKTIKKYHVIVTLSGGNIAIEHKSDPKDKVPRRILSCTVGEVSRVLQTVSAPRAIGLSTLKPGGCNKYSSFVLLSKIPNMCTCFYGERITDAVRLARILMCGVQIAEFPKLDGGVQKASISESITPSSSHTESCPTPMLLLSQQEPSCGSTGNVSPGEGCQQPQEHLELQENDAPFTCEPCGEDETCKTFSDRSSFPCTNTQLAAWPVDIFASDRKDILQKTSEAFGKTECNEVFSHFPECSTSDPSINPVECRDQFMKGWSAALDLSFVPNSSTWQAEILPHDPLQPENQFVGSGLMDTLSLPSISWVTDTSERTSVASTSDQQQREQYPAETLSAALNSSFANSHYNSSPLTQPQHFQYSDDTFHQESGLLRYMGMLVPLGSSEVATCSKSSSFKYIALHVRNTSLDNIPSTKDYTLPTPKYKDLNDISVPEYVRKGVNYDEEDLVDFQPEYNITYEDYSDQTWFSGVGEPAIVVGSTLNNGLQYFPTVPTKSFIHRMEKLFKAYLEPKMYYERNLGITNNPEKIAKFLATSDYPGTGDLNILSYRDSNLSKYWHYAPCCSRIPEMELVS